IVFQTHLLLTINIKPNSTKTSKTKQLISPKPANYPYQQITSKLNQVNTKNNKNFQQESF
ncbi:MAG: hypothetical protein K2I63_02100, partial [Helicobacter sp.]|nr:hypothetical protein [Helicobacter sp.]